MPILLAILFLLGWSTTSGEVTVSRLGNAQSSILYREYDLAGGKSEFVLGTSVLGSPDLWLPRFVLYQPVARLPQKAGGLYADTLLWNRWTLGLNGENGLLECPLPMSLHPDTPVLHLAWERYAFTGNSLRMEFQRALVPSVFFDLGLVTHSTDSSGAFRYQDITHQPYLGTLKRDSSSVPLSGRNLAFDDFSLHPRILWHGSRLNLAVNAALLRFKSDDATRKSPTPSANDPWILTFADAPFTVKTRSSGVGVEMEYQASSNIKISWQHQYTDLNHNWINTPGQAFYATRHDSTIAADTSSDYTVTPAHDTTWLDTTTSANDYTQHSQQHTGKVQVVLPGIFGDLGIQYESRLFNRWRNAHFTDQNTTLWEDREQLSWSQEHALKRPFANVTTHAQLGFQRNSSSFDKQELAPALSANTEMNLPLNLFVQGGGLYNTRFPDAEQTRFSYSGRATWANANLVAEKHCILDAAMTWKTPRLKAGIGIQRESVQNPIRLGWISSNASSLPDSVAFRWVNQDSLSNLAWRLSMGGQLGNWLMDIERTSVLHRSRRAPENPTRTYQGSVTWTKDAVNGKLHLRMRWGFQWIGNREDFALASTGEAVRVQLPHEWLLNFEARMRIQSFELYSRINNLNHTRRTPGAGYAPEGVEFRYGIEWTLLN